MAIDLKEKIIKIFETGIYYHAALQKYQNEAEGVDYLEKMIEQSKISAKRHLWQTINSYLSEHHPFKAQQIFFSLAGRAAHTDIVHYVRMMKLNRNFILPLDILSESFRRNFSAESMLDKYFSLHRLTKGFTIFDEQVLSGILQELRPLESIRNHNLLFCNRISCQTDQQSGHVFVYYDDKKTSFRQALKWTVAVIGKQDGLETLVEGKPSLNLKSYAGVLATFAFEGQRKMLGISKEHFFNQLLNKHPHETEEGFADIRFITRAKDKIDEVKKVISQFYEINKEDKDREIISFTKEPKSELLDNVDPHTRVKSALSVYMNYYAYILAHPEFFCVLYKLRTAIDNELHQCAINEAERKHYLLSILNRLDDFNNSDVEAIKQKYKVVIESIYEASSGSGCWGYFFCEDFVPSLPKIIAIFSQLKKCCCDDFSRLTHDDISSEKIHIDLNLAIIINTLLPQLNTFTAAGYGVGNPAKIMPNNKADTVGSIQAALDLFDRQLLQHYLSHVTLTHKVKKLEEIIWGMYYHYEKAWCSIKITDDKCLQQIDAWYDDPISATRFQQGKKAAKQLINSFILPTKSESAH